MTWQRNGPSPRPAQADTPRPALRRSLGPVTLTLYGLGNILGAGIYVLVGEVAGIAGSLAPIAFVIAAVVAGFTGLAYGELAARMPVSAGEAVYVERAFGRPALSVAVGLAVALAGLVSAATLCRGFTGYFALFAGLPDWLVLVSLVALLGGLTVWGIEASARAAALLTLVEAAGLVLVIAVAAVAEPVAALPAPRLVPVSMEETMAVLLGAFTAFFAFIGFEDMVNVAEEVERPERTLPLAIIAAMAVATTLYLLVVLAALHVASPTTLGASDAPLAAAYEHATGETPWLIGAIGMTAVINGVLVQLIMAARIVYGMSRNGWLPAPLATVWARTRTPAPATVLVAGIVLLLALLVPLGELAAATSFIVLVVFVLVCASLLAIRRREAPPPGVRPLPGWVPVAGLCTALALLAVRVGSAL